MAKSRTVGIKLRNEMWDSLDWVTQHYPQYNRSNQIKAAVAAWLEQFPIPDEVTGCDGQTSIFDLDDDEDE